jgi:hypothetical protein
VEQKLALEGGGGELVPRDEEGSPVVVEYAGASDPGQFHQVLVRWQPQLEVWCSNLQIEERPWM